MSFGKQEKFEDFRKKREELTTNIRKSNREEIFSKRRNIQDKQISKATGTLGQSDQRKNYVVDERYAEYIEKFLKTRYHLESLPQLVRAINDPDIVQQHYGLIGVRKIMSIAEEPPIQPMIDAGLVPRMIEYVKQEQYPQLQLEATWALTNVASGTVTQCNSIVDKGGIPLFIKLLRSKVKEIVQQAIWVVGNIASDCSIHRDTIIKMGGVEGLIYAVENSNSAYIVEHGAWAISNLLRGQPLPRYDDIKAGVPILASKLSQGWLKQPETIADICWALSYNTTPEQDRIQILIDTGFHQKIVALLSTQDMSIIIPTVRILGNMTMGSREQIKLVLREENLMSALENLLHFEKKTIRTEASWVLSNIASGDNEQIDFLLRHESLIARLLYLFDKDAPEVKRQLSYFFANLKLEGKPEIIYKFYKQVGIIKMYVHNLSLNDSLLLRDLLENLHAILELGDIFKTNSNKNPFVEEVLSVNGDKILEELQEHPDRTVYEMLVKLFMNFFEVDNQFSII